MLEIDLNILNICDVKQRIIFLNQSNRKQKMLKPIKKILHICLDSIYNKKFIPRICLKMYLIENKES